MSGPVKKSWFEKHQGLITFLGYLAATVIGGISLYNSNQKSTAALELSKNQFKFEVAKDSLNRLQTAKFDSESRQKFKYQDSLNKHQDKINNEQLRNFRTQTLTGKEQLKYFKEQTLIAKTQLRNADTIYQQQIEQNKPAINVENIGIDSMSARPRVCLKFHFYNSGKRIALVKKVSIFIWDWKSDFLTHDTIPAGNDPVFPSAESDGLIPLDKRVNNRPQLKNIFILIQFIFEDKLVNKLVTNRNFTRFTKINPLTSAQIDDNAEKLFLSRIRQAEILDRKKYLTY